MENINFIVYDEKEFDHCLNKLLNLGFILPDYYQLEIYKDFKTPTSIRTEDNNIHFCSSCYICKSTERSCKNNKIIDYKLLYLREEKLKRITE